VSIQYTLCDLYVVSRDSHGRWTLYMQHEMKHKADDRRTGFWCQFLVTDKRYRKQVNVSWIFCTAFERYMLSVGNNQDVFYFATGCRFETRCDWSRCLFTDERAS